MSTRASLEAILSPWHNLQDWHGDCCSPERQRNQLPGSKTMTQIDRRGFLMGSAAGAAGLVMLGGLAAPARAAGGPLTVGVLIPGSKSDKGWMESGYEGLMAAEKTVGAKIKVKYIENVKFGDMEQVLEIGRAHV